MLFFVLFRVQNFCCIVLALLTSGKGNGTDVYAEISFPEFYNFFPFILFSFYFFFTFYLPTSFTHPHDPRPTPTTHDLYPRLTTHDISYTPVPENSVVNSRTNRPPSDILIGPELNAITFERRQNHFLRHP